MVKLATISGGTLILILVSRMVEAPESKSCLGCSFLVSVIQKLGLKIQVLHHLSEKFLVFIGGMFDHIPKGLKIIDKEKKCIHSILGS
jgi:hypothetical protein